MRSIIFLMSLITAYVSSAQDSLYYLHVKGDYIEEGKVMLRWLPPTAGYWQVMKYYGYKVERSELDTTGKSNLDWQVLSEKLLPLPLEDWRIKARASKDSMFAAAGQAVHGYTGKPLETLNNLLDQSAELKNYFTAITFASEFSRLAAICAALGYEDTQVKKNKLYVYRITPLSTDPNYMLDMHTVIVNTSEVLRLPLIVPSEIREGEKAIEIFWDKDFYKEYYSAFNVYKSNDGKNFVKYNDVPFHYKAFKDDSKFIFRDSMSSNYIKAYYKLQGLTSYGTIGPISDVITAQGKDRTPPPPPTNVQTTYLGNGRMKITWEVDKSAKDIKGFRISRSNKVDKGFVELTKTILPADTRTFIDEGCNELINNYYFVGIIDHEGNASVSFPTHGTIIDTIAPLVPMGLKGNIDSNGVVTIKWNMGKEADLLGYVVHFSNDSKLTFYNKTDYPLRDTVWRDTIPLNVLTEKIHYKVRALDHRFNPSPFTSILTLSKPDIVPPSSPILIDMVNDKGGILLRWANSASHDVKNFVLERKEGAKGNYIKIFSSSGVKEYEEYLDTKIEQGVEYFYKLYAIDDAGLKSKVPAVASIKAYVDKKVPVVTQFKATVNKEKSKVNLTWEYDNNVAQKFIVYRSINQGQYQTYKVFMNELKYTDTSLAKGSIVKYRIKAVNKKGWQSDYSKEVVCEL